MRQPEGYDNGTGRVCQLIKTLYGLKQAGREWNKELDVKLRKKGYVMAAYNIFGFQVMCTQSHMHSHMLHHVVSHLTGHMTHHVIHHMISQHNIGHVT